ncbi:MAG: CDP-alcohol phosphatidyltransferase family protein [Ekhidna sp.]
MMMSWIRTPKRKLTLPDWLSLYRIIAAPFLLILILLEARLYFGIFLLISFLTDALDGFLARRMNLVSQRGAQFDSIGDAITFAIGLIGIFCFENAFIIEQSGLIIFAFSFYILQLFIAYLKYGMPSSFHTYLAKISAICQAVFMLWIFFIGIEYWLFYLTIVLSILETVEEIMLIVWFSEWKSDVKGFFWVFKKKKAKETVSNNEI